MIDAFNKGDLVKAQEINLKLMPLIRTLFIETNPIPVKKAVELMGLCASGTLRLPMCDMEEPNLAKLKDALRKYGLIKG